MVKKVFSRLKGKIQPLIGENPNLLRETEFIINKDLKLEIEIAE